MIMRLGNIIQVIDIDIKKQNSLMPGHQTKISDELINCGCLLSSLFLNFKKIHSCTISSNFCTLCITTPDHAYIIKRVVDLDFHEFEGKH